VAELAGVSITTVSFVMNNKTGSNVWISDETRQKVLAAARTLNYRPLSAAQALATKRSNTLAVMIPHVENLFYPHLAAAIQREAEKSNFEVVIYNTDNDPGREEAFLDALLRRGVDGVVTQTYQWSTADIDQLIEAGVAVVIHGDRPTHPFADNLMLDEVKAVEAVMAYLVRQGHRRIATIAGPPTSWGGRLRKKGYLSGLRRHDMAVEESLIRETRFKRGDGAQAMEALLALPEPPTAVFAANDLLAIDALLFAVDAGRSVPEDVAIVGFDNIPEATIVRPRLTTVHKDVNLLAAAGVEMLMERINCDEVLPARRKILPYEIIYRESA
jgi:DNA-binding LacI/PurR family transcriptional regulator